MADVKQDDYTLEKSTDDLLGEDSLPYYFEKIKLSNDDKKRLEKECMAELKEIKAEREKDKFDDLMDSLDNQYKGKLKENDARQFNIDRGVTRQKWIKLYRML